MIDKNKSAAYSEAGKALVTISGVVLFFGIVAAIIILVASFHTEGIYSSHIVCDWTGIASVIEVLFGSIFIFIFGKTVAKIANYAEAIYKQQNPDYKYDLAIERGCTFMPGDAALYNDSGEKVTIKDIVIEENYIYCKCTFANGEEKLIPFHKLNEIDAN